MYQLTLTMEERRAFTWVGSRYPTGLEWMKILWQCDFRYRKEIEKWEERFVGAGIWDDYPSPITYFIPEYRAWELAELASGQNGIDYPTFPCFDEELTSKLTHFCERIV